MKLIVLGSSSAGNCYILENNEEVLLIEAGLPMKYINEALDFDYSKVSGCLVSHRHGDHCLSLDKLDGLVDIYCGIDVAEHKGLKLYTEVEPLKAYRVGGFYVIPFEVYHDVPCLGYFIGHKDLGKLVFITDSAYSEYTFKGVNHLLVECNYDADSLNAAITSGVTPAFQRSRLISTHMELNETINIINNNIDEGLENIVLLHLSPRNSNEDFMVSKITESIGLKPYVAKPGLEVELTERPY